jgi:hypothetical protein
LSLAVGLELLICIWVGMIFTKYSYIREDWHYPSSKIIALYERIGAYVLA